MQTSWLTLRKSLLLIGAMFVTGTLLAETTLSFWSWRQEDVKAYNEIIAEFEPGDSAMFGLKVRISEYGSRFGRIFYDSASGEFGVDGNVNKSCYKEQGCGPAYIPQGEPVKIRVFLDKSLLEVFINGHTCVGIFNTDVASIGLDLFSQGGTAMCRSIDIWKMNHA